MVDSKGAMVHDVPVIETKITESVVLRDDGTPDLEKTNKFLREMIDDGWVPWEMDSRIMVIWWQRQMAEIYEQKLCGSCKSRDGTFCEKLKVYVNISTPGCEKYEYNG